MGGELKRGLMAQREMAGEMDGRKGKEINEKEDKRREKKGMNGKEDKWRERKGMNGKEDKWKEGKRDERERGVNVRNGRD